MKGKTKTMHSKVVNTTGSHRGLALAEPRRVVTRLRWLVPISLILLVVVYELLPASWIYSQYGFQRHLLMEILVFGSVGPALSFVLLDFFGRWLDERDTTDLQAEILKQAREDAKKGRKLADDAVQVMFAAGNIIDSLKAHQPNLPPEAVAQVAAIHRAMDKTVREIRTHLENP
jgi:hypothetical protein